MIRPNFQNSVAIVTGASSGIGRATAIALANHGARVALVARRQALLEKVAGEIKALNNEAFVIPTDVKDRKQVELMVNTVLSHWGQIDILVSNAGDYIRAPIINLNVQDIQRSMDINFYGGIYAILAVLPHMRERKSGYIVVVTSMDGKVGLPPDAPYVAAKFALTGFIDVLRQELYGSGIYVSNVLPGRVDTEMIEKLKVPWISAKISPDVVAASIVKAIHKRTPIVMIPTRAAMLFYVSVFAPSLSDMLIRFFRLEGWE